MQHEFGGNAAVLTLEARSLRRSVTDYRLLQSQQIQVTSLEQTDRKCSAYYGCIVRALADLDTPRLPRQVTHTESAYAYSPVAIISILFRIPWIQSSYQRSNCSKFRNP